MYICCLFAVLRSQVKKTRLNNPGRKRSHSRWIRGLPCCRVGHRVGTVMRLVVPRRALVALGYGTRLSMGTAGRRSAASQLSFQNSVESKLRQRKGSEGCIHSEVRALHWPCLPYIPIVRPAGLRAPTDTFPCSWRRSS